MSIQSDKFLENPVYNKTTLIPQILRDMDKVHKLDKLAEQKEQLWQRVNLIMIIACFASPIFFIFLPFLPIFLTLAVFAYFRRNIWSFRNYEDQRYQLVKSLLGMLSRDMPVEAEVTAGVDFRPLDDSLKYTHKSRFGGWKVKHYQDHWLSLRGRLLDGTTFLVMASERFQARSRWKLNPRGKLKHKTKSKSSAVFSLQLKFKPHKYPCLGQIRAGATEALQLPSGVTAKSLSIQENLILLKVAVREPWQANHKTEDGDALSALEIYISMFLSCYQVLNLAKALSKSERRKTA